MEKNTPYITEVTRPSTKSPLNISRLKANKNRIKFRHLNNANKNTIHEKLQESSRLKLKNQENFLTYWIDSNTKFADFEKIEAHYVKKAFDNHMKYNANKVTIEEKQKELVAAASSLEEVLCNKYTIMDESYLTIYNKRITQLKMQIKLKEHELECYLKQYSRTYKSNYWIKRRLEIERNWANIRDKQDKKYDIIKNHAIWVFKNQSSMLNNVNNFYDGYLMNNISQSDKKVKQWNQLDYIVTTLKTDIQAVENQWSNYKEQQVVVKNQIKSRNEENAQYEEDWYTSKIDWYKSKWYLFKWYKRLKISIHKIYWCDSTIIYGELKDNSLNEVVTLFNKEQSKFNNLKNSFIFKNNIISDWNKEYSQLEKRWEEMNSKIRENRLICYPQNECAKIILNVNKINIAKLKDKIVFMTSQNSSAREQLRGVETKIKQIWIFLDTCFNKMWKTFKNSDLKVTNLTLYNNLERHAINYSAYYIMNTSTKQYDWHFTDCGNDNYRSNIWYDLKFLSRWLLDFNFMFMVLYSLSFDIIADVYWNDESSPDYEVINWSDWTITELFHAQVRDSMQLWEKQIIFWNRSDKEVLVNNKVKQKVNKIAKTQQLFTKTFDFETLKEQKIFHEKYPSRSLAMINQYLNEKVTLDVNNKIISTKIKTKLNLKDFKKKTEKQDTYLITTPNDIGRHKSIDDVYYNELSFGAQSEDEQTLKSCNIMTWRSDTNKVWNNKKEYMNNWTLRSNDPEMNKIYERLNDLRKLELVFFKTKEKIPITNQEFHLIYQKWKYDYKKNQKNKEGVKKKQEKNQRYSNANKDINSRNRVRMHKMSVKSLGRFYSIKDDSEKAVGSFSDPHLERQLPKLEGKSESKRGQNYQRDNYNYSSSFSMSGVNKKNSQTTVTSTNTHVFNSGRNHPVSQK